MAISIGWPRDLSNVDLCSNVGLYKSGATDVIGSNGNSEINILFAQIMCKVNSARLIL